MAGAFLAGFAESLMGLVVVVFATFGASQDIRGAVVAPVSPHHALAAEGLYLLVDPAQAWPCRAREGHDGAHEPSSD